MDTLAVVLKTPGHIVLDRLELEPPGREDVAVEVEWSGISAGTERLLYEGRMPSFPGLGYPLVPGYEAVGRVAVPDAAGTRQRNERVFVPGARCFGPIRGLFGGAAARVTVPAHRAIPIDDAWGRDGVLMALAATAMHALSAPGATLPDLVVGHGVLGRLLARLTLALGGAAPTVWETKAPRRTGAEGYAVVDPADDPRRDYRAIYDASGAPDLLDTLIARLAPRGEVVLAGFYAAPLSFAFPPAFIREARLRIAAEWKPEDLAATTALVRAGRLRLDGLVSHASPATGAPEAYRTAFDDPACLKMVLDWRAYA